MISWLLERGGSDLASRSVEERMEQFRGFFQMKAAQLGHPAPTGTVLWSAPDVQIEVKEDYSENSICMKTLQGAGSIEEGYESLLVLMALNETEMVKVSFCHQAEANAAPEVFKFEGRNSLHSLSKKHGWDSAQVIEVALKIGLLQPDPMQALIDDEELEDFFF